MSDMIKTGGYWAESTSPREHCYLIAGKKGKIFRGDGLWKEIWNRFGELGYRFRDAGHSWDYAVISLDKPISKEHKERLNELFWIANDSGKQLGFC